MSFTRLATITLAVCLLCLAARESRADTCRPYAVGIDTSYAIGAESSIGLGEAMGETFWAADTLIQSITIWRPGKHDPEGEGWHLFIVGTDSTGTPDPGTILLDGPTVYSAGADSTHLFPVIFTFSPPFALPGPGTYEIAFLGEPCTSTLYVEIGNDVFPSGIFWLHNRSAFSGCRVRSVKTGVPSWDMIFHVEFCSPAVPTLPATWGRVKAAYR